MSDPNNYTPNSLTVTCCRVTVRILKENLLNYLLANNLITNHQHEFIPGIPTNRNLLESVNVDGVSLNLSVQLLFILFSKKPLTRSHILN